MNDELLAELNRGVTLTRVNASEIHLRARAAAIVDRIGREERTRRTFATTAEIVQWLTFDAVAAMITWSATGSIVMSAIAATAVHLGGMAAGAARAARA